MKKKHMSLPATVKSWLRRTDSWVPLGMSGQKELSSLAWGLAVSALLSLIFPSRLADRYQSLYIVTKSARILKPDAQMESFASLMSGALLGFLILALAMIPLAVYHYGLSFPRQQKHLYHAAASVKAPACPALSHCAGSGSGGGRAVRPPADLPLLPAVHRRDAGAVSGSRPMAEVLVYIKGEVS